MPPVCNICMDESINLNNRCSTCRKSLCNNCFYKVSSFATKETEETISSGCCFNCPFCRTIESKDFEDIDKDIVATMARDLVITMKMKDQKRMKNEQMLRV
jgi:hypothetical protein